MKIRWLDEQRTQAEVTQGSWLSRKRFTVRRSTQLFGLLRPNVWLTSWRNNDDSECSMELCIELETARWRDPAPLPVMRVRRDRHTEE
jgi:hypothetical protein